jgi:predicted RNA-binding protein with PIN domain
VTGTEPVVLVDARNAMRSRWPNLLEDRFLALTREWAALEGARLVVVFDGRAPGGRLGVHKHDDRVTVVGTGGEIADDWIAEHVREPAQDGARLWLVTSDRELRRRVGDRAERVIGGGAFVTELESLR